MKLILTIWNYLIFTQYTHVKISDPSHSGIKYNDAVYTSNLPACINADTKKSRQNKFRIRGNIISDFFTLTRYKLILLFFIFSLKGFSTNYYVKNAGSDAANGLTNGTAWQTLSKVNGFTFSPGDTIFLNKGDSWNEKLRLSNSGTVNNPIVVTSYGTGVKPVITGFQAATMTNAGSNIWTSTLTNSVPNQNTIMINGSLRAKARYPNYGYPEVANVTYLGYNAGTINYFVSEVSGTPDMTGAELVSYTYPFITDVVKISRQGINSTLHSDTLFFQTPLTYASITTHYFLQNHTSFLDVQNEWTYDSTTKLLSVYSTSIPTVFYSSIDTGIYLQNKNYITFQNLHITGMNDKAVRGDTCDHISTLSCTLDNNGKDAVYLRESDSSIHRYDSLMVNLNDGFFIARHSDTTTIDNCYIYKTGLFDGMAASGNGAGMAIYSDGINNTLTNNRIDSVAYDGIAQEGTNSLTKYNYITNYCYRKSDGGGIYISGNTANTGSIVRKNIMIGGIGGGGSTAAGIYFDFPGGNITADSNTIQRSYFIAVQFGPPINNIKFTDNTIDDSIGIPYYLVSGSPAFSDTLLRNIFYQRDSTKTAYFSALDSHAANGFVTYLQNSVSDYNYVLRPLKEASKFRIGNYNTNYSYSAWVTQTGWDANSQSTPSGITGVGTLYYNATLLPVTTSLNGRYIDAKGTAYINSITIQPFQSAILFYASSQPPHTLGNLLFQ